MPWDITGNVGTNPNPPSNNFLGTTDNQSFAIRTGNVERVRVDTAGQVGIGAVPDKPLTIQAQRTGQELVGFKDPSGITKWHINQNLGGVFSGLNFVETAVADGRLFLKAGGNVGIGTTDPLSLLSVAIPGESEKVQIGANPGGAGFVLLLGPNAVPHVQVSFQTSAPDGGAIGIAGPLGLPIIELTGNAASADSGVVAVTDAAGARANQVKASMFVDPTTGVGTIVAGVKNFRVPNPSQPDTDIVYACIEGPEAAAYVRGTAHLINGSGAISLPDHFVTVVEPDSMTIQLTPLSSDSRGLAVVHKDSDNIAVRELQQGTGSYDFDWEVKGVRKGHRNYKVVRPRSEMALTGVGPARLTSD